MIRGGTGEDLKAFKAFCWDYVTRRGYLSERKIKEAREFAEAATKRETNG